MERLEIYNNHVKLIEDVEQEKVRMKYTIDIAEPIEI